MEPGSNQHGVVNMTRAVEALSPWLNHPRRTIVKVEALVIAAAALLLLQLIFGSCKRRWHNSFVKYGLQASTIVMNPLIIYTLGTMQSSPIKNSSYPVWAAFLIMASAGTTAVRQYGFCDSFWNKYMQVMGEYLQDAFYVMMFVLLMDPNTYNLKTAWDLKRHLKNSRASSNCVFALVIVVFFTKFFEYSFLVIFGYRKQEIRILFFTKMMKIICGTQAAESMKKTANDGASDYDPRSMKGYKYAVCDRLCGGGRIISIDKIWDSCGNSADANALKDLCLSYALSRRLLRQRYFGLVVYHETSRLRDHDFVFNNLLPPSELDFQRAFRIIEVELGFCYDFFFTKYYHTFFWTNLLPVPFIHQSLILLKIILILMVGVVAIRRSLVLETPNPIIEVHISEADYIITLLVLGIALMVELVQAAFYLASNWAQVSLACMHVKKCCREPNAFIFGKVISFLRRVTISAALTNKIDQYSFILQWKQPGSVEVSEAVKEAIARSLRSTYANNLTTNEEESVRLQKQMFHNYSLALKDPSELEVMLIWHIATEYCHISDEPSNRNVTTPSSSPRRNRIAQDRGVAVHLSRYCAYLIRCVPELLPYHEADIAELEQEVIEERNKKPFESRNKLPENDNKTKELEGTGEEDDPTTMFQRGVKLSKQLLETEPNGHHWEVLKDFWAKRIILVAASHYTTMQHMQHLENGGELLTHVWALLAHAGILSLNRNKDQEGQTNLGSGPSVAA